jgi:hypothetical protein
VRASKEEAARGVAAELKDEKSEEDDNGTAKSGKDAGEKNGGDGVGDGGKEGVDKEVVVSGCIVSTQAKVADYWV